MKNYCVEYETELNKDNFLGKGLWTKAYKVNSEKVVIVTDDMSKECMFMFCQGENVHIPEMERLEDINGKDCYAMPFYYPLKAGHKLAWRQYSHIKHIIDTMSWTERKRYQCFPSFINAFQKSNLQKSLKEALCLIVENMQNYTDHIFLEISPRNAKVDNEGNLVLLDIVGVSKDLAEKRQNKF